MSDQDKAIIGIESCGCITFAEVVTDRKRSKAMERETDRAEHPDWPASRRCRGGRVGRARLLREPALDCPVDQAQGRTG